MNNIPLDILNLILPRLAEYTPLNTERFQTLTPASKRGILSARVVWSAYRHENPLRQLFVAILEEVPFTISSRHDPRGFASGLEELSRSEYAADLTTLSFCPMVYDQFLKPQRWGQDTQNALVIAVKRFLSVKHVRYHTLPPNSVRGCWVRGPPDGSYRWQPPDPFFEMTLCPISPRLLDPGEQAGECFHILQECFPEGTLQSFTMPYCGNLASFCAMPGSYSKFNDLLFSASLRRVAINIMMDHYVRPVFDQWIYCCPNLEVLEIALCRYPDWSYRWQPYSTQRFWLPIDQRQGQYEAPRNLAEIRLIADTSYLIDAHNLLMGLHEFPSLKRLALGHFMLLDETWGFFFDELRNKQEWDFNLERLWLLNPTHNSRHPDHFPTTPWLRFLGLESARGAATEVRLVHLNFPWVPSDADSQDALRPGDGRGYRYAGFEVFVELDLRKRGDILFEGEIRG